jgi:hypothetical protein
MKEQLESIVDIGRQTAVFQERRRQGLRSPKAVNNGDSDSEAYYNVERATQANLPQTWGHISSLKQATDILDAETIPIIAGYRQNALQALRSFFVSPDVTPAFERITSISKPHFPRLVNDFLQTKLSPRVIKAFLVYCHQVGDLFTANRSGQISTFPEGWEAAHEMLIASPLRRATVLRPPLGAAELETWLQGAAIWASLYFRDFDRRKISESELIAILQARYPPFQNVVPAVVLH